MVLSFDDFLTSLETGAAGQSRADPWQGHLRNQSGGAVQIPRRVARSAAVRQLRQQQGGLPGSGMPDLGGFPSLPGLGGGQQFTQRELEQIADPRLTEGLQMARGQLDTAQQQAGALGIEHTGQPPPGLLNAAFRFLDIPRAAVFATGRAALDPDVGFEDWLGMFQEREGFRDILISEDDEGVQRFLKGAAAFAGDVLTDPLVLVSFGATAVGKRLGSEAVQSFVARSAAQHLPEGTIKGFSQHTFSAQARSAVRKHGDLSDDARRALDALGRRSAEVVDSFGTGSQAMGDMAATAFQLEGATGLRAFLTGRKGTKIGWGDNIIEAPGLGKHGESLWNAMPADMKGGLRIRIPFAKEEGVRRAIMVAGGGGQLSQQIGLGPAVKSVHKWRGAIRASKAGQAMARTMAGADGHIYGKMIADVVQGPGNRLEGFTYGLYRTVREGQKKAHFSRKAVAQTGNETLARIQHRIGNAGSKADVDEASESFYRLVSDPDELWRLREASSGIDVDELGRLWLDLPEGARMLSKNEVLGLENAALYHDTLRDLFDQAVRAGVDITALNDHYLPRELTLAKKQELAAGRVGGLQIGSVRGLDPRRKREQFVEMVGEIGQDGVTRSRMKFLTPEQANEAAKRRARELKDEVDPIDFFETDPGVMMARYVNALSHIVSEARFAQAIRQAGGVMTGDIAVSPVMKARRLGDASERLQKTAEELRNLPVEAQSKRVREVIDDSDQLRVLIDNLINDATMAPEQQVREMAAIFKGMDALSDLPIAAKAAKGQPRLPMGDAKKMEEADRTLRQARKEFRAAAREAKQAEARVPERGEIASVLDELGLSPMGVRPDESRIRALPPELDRAYAPEVMRQALNKFYELRGPQAQSIADKMYRPYLSMFKVTATIGRGPGFHIRNIVGGMWNNHLIGVTEGDYWHAARIVKARVNAGRQARKEEVARATKRTGAGEREVARQPGFDEAVTRRAEEILRRDLSGVKVTDNESLYDVHRLMIDHEIDWRPARMHAIADVEGASYLPIGVGAQLPEHGPVSRAAQAVGVDPERLRMRGHFSGQAMDMFPGTPRTKAEAIEAGLDPELALSGFQRTSESVANLWWVRFNAGLAEMSEAYLRGSAFIQGLKRYGDPETARFLPLSTQFDYADLSNFERRILRGSLIPFYTWTRYNIPLQFRGLIQQPGKMNRINHAVTNAEEAFGDDDVDTLPEWMRDRFMFISRFKFDGNPLAFGVETPAQDLNEWFKVGRPLDATQRMARTLMSATNPAFQIPMQFLSGTEFFTGARLDADAGRHAPWWYQRLPQSVAPSWVNKDGDIMGDARIIVAGPGAVPWLGQSEKILAIMGATPSLENRDRRVSDAVRQFFPVITAGTLTPQGEAGEMFQRAQTLRTKAQRYSDPEDYERVQILREMGYDLDQISLIMERVRAKRAGG